MNCAKCGTEYEPHDPCANGDRDCCPKCGWRPGECPKCGSKMEENLRSVGGVGRTTYLLIGYRCKCGHEQKAERKR